MVNYRQFLVTFLLLIFFACDPLDEPASEESSMLSGEFTQQKMTPDPGHVTMANEQIREALLDIGHPDPAEPFRNEQELQERLQVLESALNEDRFGEDKKAKIYATFIYANGLRQQTVFEEDHQKIEELYRKSAEHYENVLDMTDETNPAHQKVNSGSIHGLAFAYAHTGKYDKTHNLLLKLVQGYQDLGEWAPYESWLAVRSAGLILGLAVSTDQPEETIRNAEMALQDIVNEHRNEVGAAAAMELFAHYVDKGEFGKAETFYENARVMLNQIDHQTAREEARSNWENLVELANDKLEREGHEKRFSS